MSVHRCYLSIGDVCVVLLWIVLLGVVLLGVVLLGVVLLGVALLGVVLLWYVNTIHEATIHEATINNYNYYLLGEILFSLFYLKWEYIIYCIYYIYIC